MTISSKLPLRKKDHHSANFITFSIVFANKNGVIDSYLTIFLKIFPITFSYAPPPKKTKRQMNFD